MTYQTKQKNLILTTLKENEGISYSAKELKDSLPISISKATIYRLLDALCKEQRICKFYNEISKVYEYQYYKDILSCHFHLHFKCNHCGKLYHLPSQINEQNFLIDYSHSMLYGQCFLCRKEKNYE